MQNQTTNNAPPEYAVVLTSCGRFDLLRQTVRSFLQFADIPPAQFIIVEDSGDEKVRDALADLDFAFEFAVHSRMGQAKSIDAGYARVRTPFIFHCEDDWEFFRTSFIAESFALLSRFPKASAVMLRGRDEHRLLRKLSAEEADGVRFFRVPCGAHLRYFGYGYNPGMRRLADYKRIAPFAEVGGEMHVSFVFQQLGFYTAHLEIPAVCHLGWGRRIQNAAKTSRIQKKIIRYKDKLKILRWLIFGIPKKWRNPSGEK
ncbi:MAG: hypothetical protein ACR2P5_07210 [Gammaproteobacteria bacterium]